LQLPDCWIRDSWIADDGELYHLPAPLVRQGDGEWALIGFRNLELEGIFAFEVLDPTSAGAQ
jgi:beta-fructofuranosidase